MGKAYTIWCEWDIGQEDNIFLNEQEALDFGEKLWNDQNMDEEVDMTLEQAMGNGLFHIEEKRLY